MTLAGKPKLALYHFNGCPFCTRVNSAIDILGIDVERRDILQKPTFQAELIEARGRRTVPVLRITTEDDDIWMPESKDIVDYLNAHFGS